MRGLLLGLGLLCCAAASSAELEPAVGLEPAWSGWVGPGAVSTEVLVQLRAAAATGPARLEVTAGADRVATAVESRRGGTSRLTLLVPAAAELRVHWTAADGRTTSASQPLHVAERPIVARVAGPPRADPADPDGGMPAAVASDEDPPLSLVEIPASALPRLAGAYSSVAGLDIDSSALTLLGADQTAALLEHLRACGFTFVSGASPAVLEALRQAAGCGARAVVAGGSRFDPRALRAAFLARAVMQPLDAAAAARLAGPDARLGGSVAALGVYLLLVGAALALPGRRRVWLGSLLAASMLVAIGFAAAAAPRRALIVWAEATSGDRSASYRARLRAAPLFPGPVTIALPPLLGDPARCDPRPARLLAWSAPRRQYTSVAVEGRLFSDPEVCFQGSFPIVQSARLAPGAGGRWSLSNLGPGAWPGAALIWHGSVYELAPLAAGATLSIGPGSGRAPRTAGERVALARAPWTDPALLLPLGLGAVAGTAATTVGWLLLGVPLDEAHAA